MRIAVNTRLLLKGKLEGIGWFTYQTLERMVKDHPEHEFFFFFDRPYDPAFVFAPNVTPVVVHPQARHPILFYIWFEWSIPYMLRKYKIDLFFVEFPNIDQLQNNNVILLGFACSYQGVLVILLLSFLLHL